MVKSVILSFWAGQPSSLVVAKGCAKTGLGQDYLLAFGKAPTVDDLASGYP
jgi:hypothetical protein